LAWKSTTDDIGNNSVCSEAVCGKGSDVVIARDIGPVLSQNSARIWFNFTEGNSLHPSPFKAKAKPANARK
jgi:hypothetical protein